MENIDNDPISREYKLFLSSRKQGPVTLYEKLCAFSEKLLHFKLDEKTSKKMQDSIDFAHLNMTTNGVASFTILFTLIICIPTFLLILTNAFGLFGIDLTLSMFIFGISIQIAY